MQARLSAAYKGAPPSSAAGEAPAALSGSLSAFSAASTGINGTRSTPLMQARLSAACKGALPSSAAGCTPSSAVGWVAAALAASLSAFSAISASRTSLVAAPRSGCCARNLASSGLKPRSGSATRSPRTASRRASAVQGSHM
eukprot:scaffold20900_cov64-Phaeocystis_antarctica.AAC.6